MTGMKDHKRTTPIERISRINPFERIEPIILDRQLLKNKASGRKVAAVIHKENSGKIIDIVIDGLLFEDTDISI
jgi:hypothetical protein